MALSLNSVQLILGSPVSIQSVQVSNPLGMSLKSVQMGNPSYPQLQSVQLFLGDIQECLPMEDFGHRIAVQAAMLLSEEPIGTTTLADANPNVSACTNDNYPLPVLAEVSFTKDRNNDRSTFLNLLPVPTDTMNYVLQKFESPSWVNKENPLITGAFGELFAPGFFAKQTRFTGYQLEWKEVLSVHGEGFYRIKSVSVLFSGPFTAFSNIFCLKPYTIVSANDTVRFEWNLNGVQGSVNNSNIVINYFNLNWYNSVRVQGLFGFRDDEHEVTEIEYQNRQVDVVRDDVTQKYTFTSGRIPEYLHNVLRQAFQTSSQKTNDFATSALSIRATDYNTNNENTINSLRILRDGGYSPDYKKATVHNILTRVTVSFKHNVIHPIKRRCI